MIKNRLLLSGKEKSHIIVISFFLNIFKTHFNSRSEQQKIKRKKLNKKENI